MSTLLTIAAVYLLVKFGAMPLIQLFRLLQQPLYPQQLDMATDVPEPDASMQAMRDEIRALGFEPERSLVCVTGPSRYPGILLRHPEYPDYALVHFRPSVLGIYPVTFFSLGADGQLHITANRSPALQPARDGRDDVTAYADNLADHWHHHRERMATLEAQDLGPDEMFDRIRNYMLGEYPEMLSAGLVIQDGDVYFLTLRGAWQIRALLRTELPKMAAVYRTAYREGELYPEFAASVLQVQLADEAARKPRPGLQIRALLLSLVLSVAAAAVMGFSAFSILALLTVIFVHESGHWIAMRAFGYRDVKMFFIPFLGGMVTGRPAPLRAWQEAVTYLAGPLPGLIIGFAMLATGADALAAMTGLSAKLMQTLGVLFVAINGLNLLPLSPLDGGRMMEVALFSRRPRLAFAFRAASVALIGFGASRMGDGWLTGFAVLLAIGLPAAWRNLRIQTQAGLPAEGEPFNPQALFRASVAVHGAPALPRDVMVVRQIMDARKHARARWWESSAILLFMTAIWILPLTLWLLMNFDPIDRDGEIPDNPAAVMPAPPTPAQLAYDQVSEAVSDAEPEEGDPGHLLPKLADAVAKLSPDDPRQIDYLATRANWLQGDEHRKALLEVIRRDREGLAYSRSGMIEQYLFDVRGQATEKNPAGTPAEVAAALAEVEPHAPQGRDGTVDTRVWLAWQADRAGRHEEATEALAALDKRLAGRPGNDPEVLNVVRAEVWRDLSAGQASSALQRLQAPALAKAVRPPRGELVNEMAWARQAAGDRQGSDAVLDALRTRPLRERVLRLVVSHRPGPDTGPRPDLTQDIAYLLAKNGDTAAAQAWLAHKSVCRPTGRAMLDQRQPQPWQEMRLQALKDTVRQYCS